MDPMLTLKALIAIIFVLIGLQYLSLLQVQDTTRFWRQQSHHAASSSRPSLIYIDSLATNCLGPGKRGSHSGGVDEGTGVPTSIGGGGNSLFSGHCFLNSLDLEEGDEEPASSFSPLQADPNDNSTSTGEPHLGGEDDASKNFTSPLDIAGNVDIFKNENELPDSKDLKPCPLIPPGLHGPIKATTLIDEVPSLAEMESSLANVLTRGGRHRPRDCVARHKVAIIIPYRDRADHLRTLLFNLHSLLPRQQLDYGIYIVEQNGAEAFNRAMLFNVGAAEALKQYDYQCFIFHDVDLMPEDDRNIYSCPVQPRHMSVAIDTFGYQLPYDGIFGGVSAMKVEHFRQVNGFSNKYWGWGAEDDDMRNRLVSKKLYISRYPANIARYKMLTHTKNKNLNPDRFKMLYSGAKRMESEGYNTLVYKRVQLRKYKLYTWVLVDLPHLKR